MTNERWRWIERIYHDALSLDQRERAAFLAGACGGDDGLLQEIESLLAWDAEAEEFLVESAMEVAARHRAEPGAESLVGRQFGVYQVTAPLGEGGMGVLYAAEDARLGRRVALKFLSPELAPDPLALARFQREARAASALNHPNICTIYDVGTHDGRSFIVMELLEGHTLQERLAPGHALPRPEFLDLGIQIVEALQAAHDKNIVHRDIKPSNIFITERGQAKILDFGLATTPHTPIAPAVWPSSQTESTDPHLTNPGGTVGTVAYMSPEQTRGEDLDCRTDLFSLGAVLYEMATGRRPFDGSNTPAIVDAILNTSPIAADQLNPRLPQQMARVITRALEKDRALRYHTAAEILADLHRIRRQAEAAAAAAASQPGRRQWRTRVLAMAAVVMALAAGAATGRYFRARGTASSTERDIIVLADFANSTGDEVFDDTLKEALAIQLEQSPFLNVLSNQQVNATLKLMKRTPGERIDEETAREICQRTNARATLAGTITALGSGYLVGVRALECDSGNVLGREQSPAESKQDVLRITGQEAASLRRTLGESLASVQKFQTPIEQATTSSLDALKAFSAGTFTLSTKGETASLPFFKEAIELDPSFAAAYHALGIVYDNLSQIDLSKRYYEKAFEYRARTSERERLSLESSYYSRVTGELSEAAQVQKRWTTIYPKDAGGYTHLGVTYSLLGDYQQQLEQMREAHRVAPRMLTTSINLALAYTNLNRLNEAASAYAEADASRLDSELLLATRYQLAFVKGDERQMAALAAAASGKPAAQDLMLAFQAKTEAWRGRLEDAWALTDRAVQSALRNGSTESAAYYRAEASLREAELGSRTRARDSAHAALTLAPNRDVQAMAALALARTGDVAAAQDVATNLSRGFPRDTLVQRYWLPTIRAAIELQHKNWKRAIGQLQMTIPYELAQPTAWEGFLYPVYLRGEAYAALNDGNAAEVEFQKFLTYQGSVVNFHLGARARFALARARAIHGDAAKARATYRDVFELWKDADQEIPVLRQAKREFQGLK